MSRAAGPPAPALGLAAAGAAAIVASRGFGTAALGTLGAGMLVLPVIVTVLVWVAAAGLRVRREVVPVRARAGDPVRVRVRLEGWVARSGLDRLLQIAIDPGIGTSSGEEEPERLRDGAWRFDAVRGDHRLPAPRLTISDPFGLARRTRSGEAGDELLVVPRAPFLERAPGGLGAPGRGRLRRSAEAGFGELDRVRDYQHGDALSRIHWGQTAKRGRLQTKELRAPEGAGRSVLVLLDGAVPPGEDFETAVVAAAALARHADRRGEPLALVHTGVVPLRLPVGRAAWPVVEVALARVAAGGRRALSLAVRGETTGPEAPDAVLVVSSGGDAALPSAVAQALARGVGVAVVLTGPAAALAGDLAAVGAEVVVVSGPGRIASSLAGTPARAHAR